MQQGSVSGHLRGCEGLKCGADGTNVDVLELGWGF